MFTGRKYYLDCLESLWRKNVSSLVVVSGRRRIGKSTLVEAFASRSGCRFFEIEGLAPDGKMTNERQLANFCARLAAVSGTPEVRAGSWATAFDALCAALPRSGRTVVFLDEISWMGGYDHDFPALLKNVWDTRLSHHGKLIVVLAGSVSAWIQDNILKSKAFVGRIALDITLPELPLANCRDFWGRSAERIAIRDMVDVLSVTGGVPKYLEEIDPSLSADENIKRLCFRPEGYLFKDFENIFGDVFGASAAKRRILCALANGPASVSDLAEKFGVEPNGHFSDDLRDLELAGFVAGAVGRNPKTGGTIREVRYRLRDNYTRFYLKFLEPKKEAIAAGLFRFTALDRLPGWDSVMGLQFENLVLNNLKALCALVGLGSRLVISAAPFVRRKSGSSPGVQIDMLLQTPKSVYVVEVKRKGRIGEEIESEVQDKVERLTLPQSKSIRTVLVYDGELDPQVEENGYFDYLIPITKMLEDRSADD